ncbi:MAG: TRAP transporter permease [Deltaproteobacteria bacterium]|nr:TRAP transporter permease [Deltaproteobacteria bacterium]
MSLYEEKIKLEDFLSIGSLIAITWSLYQLYLVVFGFQSGYLQRPLHLLFALALTFILRPLAASKGKWIGSRKGLAVSIDAALIAISIVIGIYVVINLPRVEMRMQYIDNPYKLDYIFATATMLLVFEACRRLLGWSLVVVGSFFIIYGFIGPWIPGDFSHNGISLQHFIDMNFLTMQGMYGIPIGVSVLYVFYFVLFAAFLELSGGGDLFIDLARRLAGKTRGGSAKTAVVASSLMGTISGSGVANTVATGVFTIPLMKKSGYTPTFAGAVEATASTGGQIMPPIMGAAAFVMAELVGVPYLQIIKVALIPAIIFYISLFAIVDLKAQKDGILGMKKSELPTFKSIYRRIHLIIPLIVLVASIISGATIMMAAFRSIVTVIVVSWIRPETRLGLYTILKALKNGAEKAPVIAVPAALAGIIVGVVSYTGLGLKFSYLVLAVSGGHLIFSLFLVMLTCIILGMGMPTTAAYILGAVIMSTALLDLGIDRMAAHMFIFYFAILSMVTPPIALCAYAAAGISGSGIMRTGVQALVLSLAGFMIPYVFVFNKALLMQGSVFEVLKVSISCAFGVWALAGVVVGYFFGSLNYLVRLILLAAAVALVSPQLLTDAIGFLMILCVIIIQKLMKSYDRTTVKS